MKNKLLLCFILLFSLPEAKSQQLILGAYHGVLNIGKSIPQSIRRKKNLKKYNELVEIFNQRYASAEDAKYSCDKSLEILYLNKDQSIPTKENSLNFRNHADVYQFKNPYGYCWGHAKVTQKMNRLAVFRPELVAPYAKNSKKWKKYFRKKIKRLTKYNEAQIFPEFKNLYEMSTHPYLQRQLANAVQNSWAKLAVNARGLKTGLKKENTLEEKVELFNQIKTRIERNQHPLVNMHYLGENFMETHIVVLWKYEGEIEQGIHKFCARDNNAEYDLNLNCNNYMLIQTTSAAPILYHQRKYSDIEGISFKVGVMLSYNEDVDAAEQVESLHQLCSEQAL